MEKEILEVLKTCDAERFSELKEQKYPDKTIYCRILRNGEDVFLQRVYDDELPMKVFLQGENDFLNMCIKLFEENDRGQVMGYFLAYRLVWKNYYAKKTWGLLERIKLNRKKEHFMSIDSLDLLKSMVQVGCREIGFTVFYFPKQKICIGLDALKCILLSEKKETALDCLELVQSEHEIY